MRENTDSRFTPASNTALDRLEDQYSKKTGILSEAFRSTSIYNVFCQTAVPLKTGSRLDWRMRRTICSATLEGFVQRTSAIATRS